MEKVQDVIFNFSWFGFDSKTIKSVEIKKKNTKLGVLDGLRVGDGVGAWVGLSVGAGVGTYMDFVQKPWDINVKPSELIRWCSYQHFYLANIAVTFGNKQSKVRKTYICRSRRRNIGWSRCWISCWGRSWHICRS